MYSLTDRISKLQNVLNLEFPENKIHKNLNKLNKALAKGDMDVALKLLEQITASLKTMCNNKLGMTCQDSDLTHNDHLDDLDLVIDLELQVEEPNSDLTKLINMAFLAVFLNEDGYEQRLANLQVAIEQYQEDKEDQAA